MKHKTRPASSKIQLQFSVVYLLALVVPILIIGLLLIIGTSTMLRQYNQDLLSSDNQRVRSLLFEITTQAFTMTEDICDDENVQTLLKTDFDDTDSFREASLNCSVLSNTLERSTQIESVTVYTDHPDAVTANHFAVVDDSVLNSDWYLKALSKPTAFWTILTNEDSFGNTYSYLSIIKKIPVLHSDTNAVLVIKLSDNYLKARISTNEYSTILSFDKGNVFFSDDRELYGKEPPYYIDYKDSAFQSVGLYEINGEKYLASVSSFTPYQSDSYIYLCVYSLEAYKSILNIVFFYIVIIIVALVLPGTILYFYIKHFSERVEILRERMHKASKEDYTISLALSGHDELADVYADLDVLIANIREKEAEMYQVELDAKELKNEQQEMEYKMLSSQINPHFLYNTLETIRMKAITAGNKEVANAVKLLGKSMRYVLENTATSKTTLDKELEYVTTYLNIQKLRFEDRINYTVNVEDGLNPAEISILPLILQPIVENSILHGLEKVTENGQIDISVSSYEEDKLSICVSDNGQGLTPEELSDINEKLSTPGLKLSSSIGLYNIHERIRLFYGYDYGITIESTMGQGTSVNILIPKVGI